MHLITSSIGEPDIWTDGLMDRQTDREKNWSTDKKIDGQKTDGHVPGT